MSLNKHCNPALNNAENPALCSLSEVRPHTAVVHTCPWGNPVHAHLRDYAAAQQPLLAHYKPPVSKLGWQVMHYATYAFSSSCE